MISETNSCIPISIVNTLRENGELRIEDFSKERVEELNKLISESYEEGLGISGTSLSKILYGYNQPLSKFEGIAFYAFDLVATRVEGKKGGNTLFLVRTSDAGKTIFPVAESVYHNYSQYNSVRNAVNAAFPSSAESSSSIVTSTLSEVLSKLGEVCDSLSSIVSTIK